MDQRSSSGSTSCQEFSVINKCGSSKRMARSLVAVELHLLPHDVLRDILSRLSIRDVVRMSILSREWRRLRICHPDLVLTLGTFLARTLVLVVVVTNLETATTEFITNVDNLLRPLWSTSTTSTTTLDKFVIKFCLRRNDKYHIDRWVNFSTASRAKHIALDFTEFAYFDSTCCKDMYIFPLCNLSGQNGSCVKSLNLGYVCLKLPPSFCGITNLKKLALNMVSISGSDLQFLLLSCALLESISIERCSSFSSLRIRQELCRLQYLRVRHCKLKMIELCAPNLTKFELDEDLTKIVLVQCLKLSEATFVSNLREYPFDDYGFRFTFTELPTALLHVHKLFLLLNVDQVPRFTQAQSRFSNLRNLNMNLLDHYYDPEDTSWVVGLVDLLELAPLLAEMELHIIKNGPRCWLPEPKMVTAVPGPLHRHLRSVHMSGICHVLGLLELALYILGNATVLERMVINPVVHANRFNDDIHSFSEPVSVEWDSYDVDETRMIAKQHLDRDEFRHILTFL